MSIYEEKLTYWDEEHREIKTLTVKDAEEKLDSLLKILRKCLEKLKNISKDYELSSFEVGLALKAGLFVVSAEGSMTLTHEKVKPS